MLDSHYSYVHFSHANQAAFMEQWTDYKIAPNDIDTTRLFELTASTFPLLNEEDDESLPPHPCVFAAKVYRNRNMLQKKAWADANLDVLRPKATVKKLPDLQILRLLHCSQTGDLGVSLNDFLTNGYNAEPDAPTDDLADYVSNDDIWLNTTSEYLANHTFSNMKMRSTSGTFQHGSSYTPQSGSQTPRMPRRRPSQEKFQTPINSIR